MSDGKSTSIARVCCLQPGVEGTPAHLECQDANSKRPCVVGCQSDADCHGTLKCKPWGDTHRTSCQ